MICHTKIGHNARPHVKLQHVHVTKNQATEGELKVDQDGVTEDSQSIAYRGGLIDNCLRTP